jgi:hypothetical protein
MDEKWCQNDIMVIVIGELHSSENGVVAIELQLSCNELHYSVIVYTMDYTSCNLSNLSNNTHGCRNTMNYKWSL